jgi:hypothetical protein
MERLKAMIRVTILIDSSLTSSAFADSASSGVAAFYRIVLVALCKLRHIPTPRVTFWGKVVKKTTDFCDFLR